MVLPYWWSVCNSGSRFLCSWTCCLFAHRRNCWGDLSFSKIKSFRARVSVVILSSKSYTCGTYFDGTPVYIVALSHLFKTCFPNLTQKKVHWSSTLLLKWRGNYSMLMSSNFYSVYAGSGNFFFTRKNCCSRNQPLNKSMLQILQIPKNLKLD